MPILQPADPFLDMAGEDLRRRIFLTESETGQTLCLRPEFTVPVRLAHIGARRPGRRAAIPISARCFRQRREGGNEFFQAGLEDLGDRDTGLRPMRARWPTRTRCWRLTLPGRDAEDHARRPDDLRGGGGGSRPAARLAACGLPAPSARPSSWRRHWPTLPARRRMARCPSPRGLRWLLAGDADRLAAHIVWGMAEAGLSPAAGRTPAEIARRAHRKGGAAQRAPLLLEAFAALKDFSGNPCAAGAIGGCAAGTPRRRRGANVAGRGAERNSPRAPRRFEAHGLPLGGGQLRRRLRSAARLLYRPGVRDFFAGDAARPLVGGGRYDRLLTLLGAQESHPRRRLLGLARPHRGNCARAKITRYARASPRKAGCGERGAGLARPRRARRQPARRRPQIPRPHRGA